MPALSQSGVEVERGSEAVRGVDTGTVAGPPSQPPRHAAIDAPGSVTPSRPRRPRPAAPRSPPRWNRAATCGAARATLAPRRQGPREVEARTPEDRHQGPLPSRSKAWRNSSPRSSVRRGR